MKQSDIDLFYEEFDESKEREHLITEAINIKYPELINKFTVWVRGGNKGTINIGIREDYTHYQNRVEKHITEMLETIKSNNP